MLSEIRDFIPTTTASALYKTMILPFLEFGNNFLLNGCETDIVKLQKTQNKCLRFILKKDGMYKSEQLHRDARLES